LSTTLALINSTVTISPSLTLAVNGTVVPFLLIVRQNKSQPDIATSRTVVSSLIVTMDRTWLGSIKVTVINTTISNLPAQGIAEVVVSALLRPMHVRPLTTNGRDQSSAHGLCLQSHWISASC